MTKNIVDTCIPKLLEIIQKWDKGNSLSAEKVAKDVILETLLNKIRAMSLKEMMTSISYVMKGAVASIAFSEAHFKDFFGLLTLVFLIIDQGRLFFFGKKLLWSVLIRVRSIIFLMAEITDGRLLGYGQLHTSKRNPCFCTQTLNYFHF